MSRRVAITGLGCVTAAGQSAQATWAACVEGRTAIRQMARRFGDHPSLVAEGPAAFIDKLDPGPTEAVLGPRALTNMDPFSQFSVAAATEALSHAGLLKHPVLEHRTAVLFGAGSGGNQTIEEAYTRIYEKKAGSVHPLSIPKLMISAPVSHISMLHGVRGPAFVVSSACASSAHALAEGMHMIRAGRAEVVIAGGVEACLTLGSWFGWKALQAMAPDTCRPFSIDRKGMVLGEGAACLVLEDYEHARARGAEIWGELAGAGASADAHHITMPHGGGAETALRLAHEDASVPLDTPVLISSHGTGTPLNDKVESQALSAVYGEALSRSRVIATKSAHGHVVGGGGALELLVGLMALKRRTAPPILNYLGPDPDCTAPLVLGEAQDIDYDVLVSNSFAFGGLNAVLIAKRV